MFETTYTLQAASDDFSLDVSYYVYLRMRRYLDEHNCRYKIISADEYIGKDKENSELIQSFPLVRSCILQFETGNLYHEMVKELVSFEMNVLNNE